MKVEMKRAQRVQQGQQDRISSDKLVLFRRVLGTPIYTSSIMFCYAENCHTWQCCGRGAGYHRF